MNDSDDFMSDTGDESPPEPRSAGTPAERAGATPLDPERFKANVGMPVGQRQRELLSKPAVGDQQVDPVVRRPRGISGSANRNGRSAAKPWLLFASALAVAGLVLGAVALVGDEEMVAGHPDPPPQVASTPVLSPRRSPELLARPVAARNLEQSIAPVLSDAPPDTCLSVYDGPNLVAAQQPALGVVPASNMKLITSAAALGLLDPAGRFTTSFVTDGAPTDGKVVKGNLYMIGGGDPLLSTQTYLAQLPNGRQPSTDMSAVADQIAATGIREITGSVVGDGTRYDDVRGVDAWPQRYFGQGQVSPLSALIVNDSWSPGTGPAQGDPAAHAARVMTELLEQRGIAVAGEPRSGTAPEGASRLTEVDSIPVSEIVAEGLQFSDNTTMEMLVKEMGLQGGGSGSTAAGLTEIREWITANGLPDQDVVLDDGSGLSEKNRLTCGLLAGVVEREGPEGVIANGLARPGRPGTLNDRLLSSTLRDRVRAKTGTLRPVTALSGWLSTVPGADLAFSFVVNRPQAQVTAADTALQSRLLEAMTAYPERPELTVLSPTPPVELG